MRVNLPELPSEKEWNALGLSNRIELHGGKQSRVFASAVDERHVAVKLTVSSLTNGPDLRTRMMAQSDLASRFKSVVAPVRLGGKLVQRVGDWLMTATELILGDELNDAEPEQARQMGRALADLHQALASIRPYDLQPVTALANRPAQPGWQLLHGDFSSTNLIATPEGLRVIDFDDCGYGPIEYDVGNSLYMVLFDGEVAGDPDHYEHFREYFLEGYARSAGRLISQPLVDAMIEARIAALAGWINDLTTAPIGIRTASAEWHEVLRTFVAAHTYP